MNGLPILMFWLLGLIWGSSFIYMKIAAALISPEQIVLLRVLFGFVPIAAYALMKGAFNRSHFRHIGHILVMSVVGTIGYYYGFAVGSSLLPSGIAGALSGLTPILSFLLALLLLREDRSTLVKAIGIALGSLGVLAIARPFAGEGGAADLEGVLFNAIGSFSVGASFVYAKKFIIPLKIPFSALITYQLALSALLLLIVVDLDGINTIWTDATAAAGLALGLGVLGTGAAFIIYYYIIDRLGAVTASSVAYVPPVVALLIGVLLVGENIQPWDYAGAALILVGVYLVNRKPPASTGTADS